MFINIEYNTNGTSEVNVDEVCDNWLDSFSIKFKRGIYTLKLCNRDLKVSLDVTSTLKVTINEMDAKAIIDKLFLVEAPIYINENPRPIVYYYSKKRIQIEIDLINECLEMATDDNMLLCLLKQREYWSKAKKGINNN